MSQEDLSGKARIGVRTIRDIEAGRSRTPRPATLRLLADAFGLHGPDRDRFHELAHDHVRSDSTAGTAEVVVDATSDEDGAAGSAVEDVPPQIGEDRTPASSPPSAADGQETVPAEDSNLGLISEEGIHTTRSRITLLPRHWGALTATKKADIADHNWLITAMLDLARGRRLHVASATRRYLPGLTMRLSQGVETWYDRHSVGRNRLIWVALISLPILVLTLYLLAMGERGQSIATVLAVPVSIYAIAVALITNRRPSSPASPATRGRRRPVITAAAVVLAAILPGAIWWGINRYSDLDVQLGDPFQLADGDSHIVDASPAEGKWEGRLAFVPRLASNSVANDCVLPTWLIIAPEADGQILASERVRHGQRVSLPIPASTRQVRIRIEYVDPGKQGCIVTVTLSGAALER